MGVLSCNRDGCKNIMCDRFSYTYGYLCDRCFNELCEKGAQTNLDVFIGSRREFTDPLLGVDSQEFFGKIFVHRDDK